MGKTLPLQTINTTPYKPAFGDMVDYHHRAGVARFKKLHKELPDVGWKIIQGVNADDTFYLNEPGNPFDSVQQSNWFMNHIRYAFSEYPQAQGSYYKCNKTVMVWPSKGAGMIVGYIRKAIGQSQPGYTSGYEYPEYEPGYFAVDMYVDLYVVKKYFHGINTILCPVWAVQPFTSKELSPEPGASL